MASITKLTGHPAVFGCVPGGARLRDIGVSDVVVARPAVAVPEARVAVERPTQAPAVAAAARIGAYEASAANATSATNGAGTGNQIFGQQKTQLHPMWALRGLDPWSDPA
ncbi:hypothetical protein [Streptomyces sp. 6N223]|uniref:hypothetical protein n=1 Tax=Streptomyces sp. 6N223 TaxID=3457412 RepID=UPI003FD348F9